MDESKPLGRDEVRMLVLHLLGDGPSHGYALARAVEESSAEVLRLGEGTLYPVLRALERDGLVTSKWQSPATGPARKVYVITSGGRAECARRVREWRLRSGALGAVLQQGAMGHA